MLAVPAAELAAKMMGTMMSDERPGTSSLAWARNCWGSAWERARKVKSPPGQGISTGVAVLVMEILGAMVILKKVITPKALVPPPS